MMDRLSIGLYRHQMQWLDKQAKACGVPHAEIIRRMIDAERTNTDLSQYLIPPTERERKILAALREKPQK